MNPGSSWRSPNCATARSSGEPADDEPQGECADDSVLKRLIGTLIDHYYASYAKPPGAVALEIDEMVDNHGGKQLSFWSGNYGQHCFLPIRIYETATRRPVAMLLRTGKPSSGSSRDGGRYPAADLTKPSPLAEYPHYAGGRWRLWLPGAHRSRDRFANGPSARRAMPRSGPCTPHRQPLTCAVVPAMERFTPTNHQSTVGQILSTAPRDAGRPSKARLPFAIPIIERPYSTIAFSRRTWAGLRSVSDSTVEHLTLAEGRKNGKFPRGAVLLEGGAGKCRTARSRRPLDRRLQCA
jgi:hypothetical protein